MAVTWANFVIDYRQFSTLEEARFNRFLAKIAPEIALTDWGDQLDLATEMLLGHFLSVADSGGNSQGIVEKLSSKVSGDYDVSFAASKSDYDSTWFGREYERLLKNSQGLSAETNVSYCAARVDLNKQIW